MKYKVSNVNEMRQAAESIKTGKEPTYLLESAAGKRYVLDFAKYDENILPFWIATTSSEEVENPYYVEPAPAVVEEPEVVETVEETEEIVKEAPDFEENEAESDEVLGLREEIEKLSAENERLRKDNEALLQNVVHENEEVSVVDLLEYVTIGDFIEFVAKHCKTEE